MADKKKIKKKASTTLPEQMSDETSDNVYLSVALFAFGNALWMAMSESKIKLLTYLTGKVGALVLYPLIIALAVGMLSVLGQMLCYGVKNGKFPNKEQLKTMGKDAVELSIKVCFAIAGWELMAFCIGVVVYSNPILPISWSMVAVWNAFGAGLVVGLGEAVFVGLAIGIIKAYKQSQSNKDQKDHSFTSKFLSKKLWADVWKQHKYLLGVCIFSGAAWFMLSTGMLGGLYPKVMLTLLIDLACFALIEKTHKSNDNTFNTAQIGNATDDNTALALGYC